MVLNRFDTLIAMVEAGEGDRDCSVFCAACVSTATRRHEPADQPDRAHRVLPDSKSRPRTLAGGRRIHNVPARLHSAMGRTRWRAIDSRSPGTARRFFNVTEVHGRTDCRPWSESEAAGPSTDTSSSPPQLRAAFTCGRLNRAVRDPCAAETPQRAPHVAIRCQTATAAPSQVILRLSGSRC
jgi:hypothetical protein